MSMNDRARQFLPFDAQKGLKEAIRLKEIEYERIKKRDISEEKCVEISDTLFKIEKNDLVSVTYFNNGEYLNIKGKIKLKIEEGIIEVDKNKIDINDIFDLKLLEEKGE